MARGSVLVASIVVAAASGCSVLLGGGGDGDEPSDAAVEKRDAAALDAAPCTEVAAPSPIDDVELTEDNPAQTIDQSNLLNVRRRVADDRSVVLLRFELAAADLDEEEIDRARLELTYPITAGACGGEACANCSGIEASGRLDASWGTSTWSAEEVSWNGPSIGADWSIPGMNGGSERSALIASTPSVPEASEVIRFDRAALDEAAIWFSTNPDTASTALTIVLDSTPGTVVLASAIENAELCMDGAPFPPPRLVLESCD
jgi:hypothetical protein